MEKRLKKNVVVVVVVNVPSCWGSAPSLQTACGSLRIRTIIIIIEVRLREGDKDLCGWGKESSHLRGKRARVTWPAVEVTAADAKESLAKDIAEELSSWLSTRGALTADSGETRMIIKNFLVLG